MRIFFRKSIKKNHKFFNTNLFEIKLNLHDLAILQSLCICMPLNLICFLTFRINLMYLLSNLFHGNLKYCSTLYNLKQEQYDETSIIIIQLICRLNNQNPSYMKL